MTEAESAGRKILAVFVPYTIVGETVRVIIIKVNKSYAIGKLTEVVVPSEMRTKAECPYFYKCRRMRSSAYGLSRRA